jgi:hypothetical protein
VLVKPVMQCVADIAEHLARGCDTLNSDDRLLALSMGSRELAEMLDPTWY